MQSAVPLALVSLLLPLTFAKDIPITVGADSKLAFNPSIVTAAVGDTLTFSYFAKNHSVGQSSFADPCHPLAGGFFSGFQPLAAGPGPVEFVVPVNDTKPIWVYCAQTKGSHCQMGMSMVVNQPKAPPSPNTLDAYKQAAAKTGNSTAPPNIAGGRFISLNSTSSTGHNPTASGTASGGVASSTGSSAGGSSSGSSGSSGSSSGGAGTGSSSGSSSSSGSTTEGFSSTSPSSATFQGAAVKFASGLVVNLAAPGIVACALI